jgi:hypothetical protein
MTYPETNHEKDKWNYFIQCLQNKKFSIDDTFWLNGIEFQVTKIKKC